MEVVPWTLYLKGLSHDIDFKNFAPSGTVFTDVQISIRQRVAFSRCSDIGQSIAPIGSHKTDAASDRLLIK